MAAPANSILTAGLGDLHLTEAAAGDVLLLLADRETMRNDPAVNYLGNAAGSGSTVGQISIVGLDGSDEMAAVAEGVDATNTALTDASASVTIARQALRYEMSDLARSVDPATGVINPMRFARSMVRSADMRLQSMIAGITDDFTATAGTSGVNMTVTDWYDAQTVLILASVPGPYLCMLHPVQYSDFQRDLRSEGGAKAFEEATAAQLALRGPGYQGRWNGAPIFTSSKVPTANAGADRAGGFWGRGGIGFRDASIPPLPGSLAGTAIFAGPIMIAYAYNAAGGLLSVNGSYQVGVIQIEDDRGCSIITDA